MLPGKAKPRIIAASAARTRRPDGRDLRKSLKIRWIGARSSAGLEYCPPKAGVARSNRVGRAKFTTPVTVLNSADEVPAAPLPSVRRVLVATTCAFLLVAPFSGSAGWRAASLLLAAAALAFDREEGASRLRAAPRGFVLAWIAWALLAIASVGWSERPAYSATELRAELLYGTLALGVFFAAGSSAARLRTWWCVLMAGSALAFAAPLLEHLLGMRFSRHDLDGGPGPWSTHLVLVAPAGGGRRSGSAWASGESLSRGSG